MDLYRGYENDVSLADIRRGAIEIPLEVESRKTFALKSRVDYSLVTS